MREALFEHLQRVVVASPSSSHARSPSPRGCGPSWCTDGVQDEVAARFGELPLLGAHAVARSRAPAASLRVNSLSCRRTCRRTCSTDPRPSSRCWEAPPVEHVVVGSLAEVGEVVGVGRLAGLWRRPVVRRRHTGSRSGSASTGSCSAPCRTASSPLLRGRPRDGLGLRGGLAGLVLLLGDPGLAELRVSRAPCAPSRSFPCRGAAPTRSP